MPAFIPTCESAVCTVPEWHRADLKGCEERITSSEGWSPGALNLAQGIASKLHAQLLHTEMSRLIIDLSKHPEDEQRWSNLSSLLTPDQRQRLDQRQKEAYLSTLTKRADDARRRNEEVIHLSVDTEPGLDDTWLVFSYDSRRSQEADWTRTWAENIRQRLPNAVIRERESETRSLSGYLRGKYTEGFSSVRLTANQEAFLGGKPIKWASLKKAVIDTIPR